MHSYNFAYDFYNGFGGFNDPTIGAFLAAFFGILIGAFAIVLIVAAVAYVFFALALQRMAKNRGIENAWLAWVPIANNFLIGQVVDQIRASRGEKQFFAPVLLSLASASVFISIFTQFIAFIGILGVPVSLGLTVFIYWAYYEIFKDYTPKNAVLFLVLSIVFSIPWVFMFILRDRQPISMGGVSDMPQSAPPTWQNPAPPQGWHPPAQYAPPTTQPAPPDIQQAIESTPQAQPQELEEDEHNQ